MTVIYREIKPLRSWPDVRDDLIDPMTVQALAAATRISMSPQFYGYLGFLLLILTGVGIVWRKSSKPDDDKELIVAFIRLDFPPKQRDIAQKIAAGLAEIVGLKIKQLRPEHTLEQIADWAENRIYAKDLINLFLVSFGVKCDAHTTFRNLVERVANHRASSSEPGSHKGST